MLPRPMLGVIKLVVTADSQLILLQVKLTLLPHYLFKEKNHLMIFFLHLLETLLKLLTLLEVFYQLKLALQQLVPQRQVLPLKILTFPIRLSHFLLPP